MTSQTNTVHPAETFKQDLQKAVVESVKIIAPYFRASKTGFLRALFLLVGLDLTVLLSLQSGIPLSVIDSLTPVSSGGTAFQGFEFGAILTLMTLFSMELSRVVKVQIGNGLQPFVGYMVGTMFLLVFALPIVTVSYELFTILLSEAGISFAIITIRLASFAFRGVKP